MNLKENTERACKDFGAIHCVFPAGNAVVASTEVEEILKQIKERLTGDKKQDLKYLKGQMEAFHGHEFGGEIAKECSRLM